MDGRGAGRVRPTTWMALGVAAAYGCVGALWIGFSDQFVAGLELSAEQFTRAQQYKGWAYVGITAALLFLALHYLFHRLARAQRILEERNTRLQALNRIYRMVRAIKGALLQAQAADVLFQETCRIAVAEGGYRLAWIGLLGADGQHLSITAHAGAADAIPMDRTLAPARLTDSAVATALEEARPAYRRTRADPALAVRSLEEARLGYAAVAALPLGADGTALGVLVIYADAADAFDAAEERNLLAEIADNVGLGVDYLRRGQALDRLSRFDPVTGLANRRLFEQQVTPALARAERDGKTAAIVLVDIDGLGEINRAAGRHAGDRALQAVAQILGGSVRPGDSIARTGNDEFAVLLADVGSSEEVAVPVGRLADHLGQRLDIGGEDIFLTASLGVASYPNDGRDLEELYTRAELALRSRGAGERGAVHFYAAGQNERAQHERRLEQALRTARFEHEFSLAWQPIVDAQSGATWGVEALLRWHSPTLGRIGPDRFIPIAERTGEIIALGEYVLRRACAQASEWGAVAGLERLRIGVNVALRQLHHPGFPALVAAALAAHPDRDWQLVLEITEREFMRDPEATARVCADLRSRGCAIHIDDFGTGYSALGHINRLPVDGFKLDRSFVTDAWQNAGARCVLEAMVELGNRLGLAVIAEGVETAQHLQVLRASRCRLIQGFHYARPLAAPDLARDYLCAERRSA